MVRISFLRSIALACLAAFAFPPAGARAQTVDVPYQGWLTQGELPCNGPHSMVFSLYDDPAGATPKWSDTYDVAVSNGAFSVVLPVPEAVVIYNAALYLGITVEGVDLVNRQQIYPAMYAVRSAPGVGFHIMNNLFGQPDDGGRRYITLYDSLYVQYDLNVLDNLLVQNPAIFEDYINVGMHVAFGGTGTTIKGFRKTYYSSNTPTTGGCGGGTSYPYCRQLTSVSSSICYMMADHADIACELKEVGGYYFLISNRPAHEYQCTAGCLEWNW
jgi:hypothetical protein